MSISTDSPRLRPHPPRLPYWPFTRNTKHNEIASGSMRRARDAQQDIATVSDYVVCGTFTLRLGFTVHHATPQTPPRVFMCATWRRVQTRVDGRHTPRDAQCQIRAVRGEHQNDHGWRWEAAPRARHGQVARDGARAYGAACGARRRPLCGT